MSEVSSWSATDASNNLTPPDGWPEGMQPSGVNNVGRMMMGAIRRWYDTVSVGIANALPLSGGTLTGPIVAPQVTSTGNINATFDIGAGRNMFATGNLSVGGAATITGSLTAGGINTNGLNATSIHSSGDISANGNGTINGTLNVGALGVADDLVVGDSIGAVRITASSFITTATYQLEGLNFAYRGSDVAGLLNTICDPTGFPAIDMYGAAGTYYRCDNAHSFTNRAATLNICRFQATDGNCINASGLWNVISDERVKRELEPYEAGLPELERLNVVSYRYTEDAPFNDGQVHYGLVAQDVETVLPEMIRHAELSRPGSDETADYLTMAPGHLVFVLLNATKQLAAQNAELSARLATLEGDRHV